MYEIQQCPVCGGKTFSKFLACEDYTVSHGTFNLIQCKQCDLVITSPRPHEDDLGRFYSSPQYISHSKVALTLFDKVYQISRTFALNWKLNLIKENSLTPVKTLLDFGCGTGSFLQKCSNAGLQVTGVEPSDRPRQIANENLPQHSVYQSINDISGTFQVITLWHVLEHIPDLNNIIDQLKHRLEQNGTIFLAVPNHLSYDAKTYRQHWAGYDVPRHLWHFNKKNMEQLMNTHGLKLQKIIPMKLDAFYVSMLSEQYKGNGKISSYIKGSWNGLKSNIRARKDNQYSSLIYVVQK
jgi:2-polyprenyl-3-methyl-5-hydroxy-6-metoxy-1,4-benzoquinol methylase